MSIFDYQAAIKITFDKEIVTDPEIITGTEYYKPISDPLTPMPLLSGGDYSGQPKEFAFDSNLTTYWMGGLVGQVGNWIGKDFTANVEISKVRISMYSGRCINAYKIQGSDNGSTWIDVYTGNLANAVGWQEISFTGTTYRYWRLYAVSIYSYWTAVYEIEFLGTRQSYDVSAWTVTGSEYDKQPEGSAINGAYTVRKVTKTPDNLSVILWLDMFDRMRDPAGQVTVSYNQLLGNLIGPYSAQVVSFSVLLTPTNIVPYSNPHDRENLSALSNMTVSVMEVAYKYIPAESNTFLVADVDNPYMDENISAIANMTVVVTKVGELPL